MSLMEDKIIAYVQTQYADLVSYTKELDKEWKKYEDKYDCSSRMKIHHVLSDSEDRVNIDALLHRLNWEEEKVKATVEFANYLIDDGYITNDENGNVFIERKKVKPKDAKGV